MIKYNTFYDPASEKYTDNLFCSWVVFVLASMVGIIGGALLLDGGFVVLGPLVLFSLPILPALNLVGFALHSHLTLAPEHSDALAAFRRLPPHKRKSSGLSSDDILSMTTLEAKAFVKAVDSYSSLTPARPSRGSEFTALLNDEVAFENRLTSTISRS